MRLAFACAFLVGCHYQTGHLPRDPATADAVPIDRFSDAYAHAFRRSQDPSLPGPNAPIDFDVGRLLTRALGPRGERITQYSFDVHDRAPIVLYHTLYASTRELVPGQPSIADLLPGDPGATDFWQLVNVLVPDDYVPNTLTSAADVVASPYEIESTRLIVNCPPVPAGSTARRQLGSSAPVEMQLGWYKDRVFHYFTFGDPIEITDDGIRTASVFVALKADPVPGAPLGAGAPVGWAMEEGSSQTHNVVASLPTTDPETYSPLWRVAIYAMRDFERVTDLPSAQRATVLTPAAALLNWPIVAIDD